MIHLFALQMIQPTTQVVQMSPPPGMTPFDMMLISAIVTVVVGIGSFITWVVKGAGPRLMSAFEKRNDALVSASEKTAEAVGKIPEAIKSFEVALLGAEKRLVEKFDAGQDRIIEELHDKRISDLAEAVRTGPHPAQPSCPGGRTPQPSHPGG